MAIIAIKSTTSWYKSNGYQVWENADCIHVQTQILITCWLRLKSLRKPKGRTQCDFSEGDQFRLELMNKYQHLTELGDAETTHDPEETDPDDCGAT